MAGRIEIIQGDITEMAVDAIVNAANSDLFVLFDHPTYETFQNRARAAG